MADPYANEKDPAPVSPAGRHDRHDCAFYKKNISPCKDCLPAHHSDDPVPMCASIELAGIAERTKDSGPEAKKTTKRIARNKDVEVSPGVHQSGVGCIPESLKFGDLGARAAVLRSISEERDRHKLLGFTVDYSFDKFCRIMAEELGEVAKAMDTGIEQDVMTEAIQLASMAVSLCESIMIRKVNKMVTLDLPEKP